MSYARTDVDQIVIGEGDDDIQSTAALAQVGQRILTALRNVNLNFESEILNDWNL